jgi:hypothetical protein
MLQWSERTIAAAAAGSRNELDDRMDDVSMRAIGGNVKYALHLDDSLPQRSLCCTDGFT